MAQGVQARDQIVRYMKSFLGDARGELACNVNIGRKYR